MMKRLFAICLFAIVALLSLAASASAYTYGPYGTIYGYTYSAGGYPAYNFHPTVYGPRGWTNYGPFYHGGYLYPNQGYFYGYNSWYPSYYYRGYGGYGYGGYYGGYGGYYGGYQGHFGGYDPWFSHYWPYTYRVYQRRYP